jgi:peptidoglycan/xylan/chitin deacetylase (PgdA/CDA1 family)
VSRPAATVSVDLDPVDLHLVGYGYRGLPPDPLAYTAALPRLCEIFDRCGLPVTFFMVARDAPAHADAIASVARAGHEVASHSLTHPLALASLGREPMRRELEDSRRLLEQASGASVLGFRAPNFDLSARVIEGLGDAGYLYDASGYPTPMMVPARLLLAWKSRDAGSVLQLRAWPYTWRREPHRITTARRRLVEYPVSVTPTLRMPVYHTPRYLIGDRRFEAILDGFAQRGEPLSYVLHGVDVLGLHEDKVDDRLARHPGMDQPLQLKIGLLERTLQAIARRFAPATFRDRLVAAPAA